MTAFAYYLLKVIICSGILFLYYHAALKNKAFHQWNRFYLLLAVLLSLLLPLIQFTIFHSGEEESKAIQLIQVVQSADIYLKAFTVSAPSSVSPEQWVFTAYLLVCFMLLSSFLISLSAIFSLLRKHTVRRVQNIRFVGTKEPGTPFSFLNYIFWNDAISLQSQTGQQIFQHELVHVKEKHTLDKLFMQGVLMLFWINPFFWLIRKELKFIHEFIADKKAVGEYGADAFAAMILQTVYPQHYHSITNQFFQTSIKRRLLMLTKIQNPQRAYFSRIIVLPLIALTVVIFSFRTKPVPASQQSNLQNFSTAPKETVIDLSAFLGIVNDTPPPKSNKEISTVDVRTRKEIAITYSDGTSEVVTEQEANARGLINNGGYGNEKLGGKSQLQGSFGVNGDGPKPLIVVDGKEQKDFDLSHLDAKMIGSINVLKKESALVLYGEKGKNGVVEITMKKELSDTPINIQTSDGRTLRGSITSWNIREKDVTLEANIEEIKPAVRPLYLVDGEEITEAEMGSIDTKMIESINVLKDKSAIDKYGPKGRNGVVEIKLKKELSVDPLTFQQNGKEVIRVKADQLKLQLTSADSSLNEVVVIGNQRDRISLNSGSLYSKRRSLPLRLIKIPGTGFLKKAQCTSCNR
jgi:beta-lactamase regulating signal transducer with metallopeptidase domain